MAPIGRGPLGKGNDAEIVMTGLVPVIHVVELAGLRERGV
jgi:hypothetical protein